VRPLFNIYIISDNHFNHWNINKYCKRRFRSLDEMNRTMIKKWNNTIREQDIVISLGDIVFTKGESSKIFKIIKQLKGRKILVKGNHDRKSYSFYLSHGFDFICERFDWYYNHKKILFLHDPNKITSEDIKKHDFIIHGHIHNKLKMIRKRKNCILANVSVEQINYTPISLISLLYKTGRRKNGQKQ